MEYFNAWQEVAGLVRASNFFHSPFELSRENIENLVREQTVAHNCVRKKKWTYILRGEFH